VTRLCEGQTMTVLQLPAVAQPAAAEPKRRVAERPSQETPFLLP
jgi:hypothetical protein